MITINLLLLLKLGVMKMPKDFNKIGAMWKKKQKGKDEFFSMELDGRSLVAFKNNFKEEDKHPDFIVYERAGGETE